MNRFSLIMISFLLICCGKKDANQNKSLKTSISSDKLYKSREDSLKQRLKIQDSIKIIEMTYDEDGNYAVFIDYNRNSDYYDTFDYLTKINHDYEYEYLNYELGKYKTKTAQKTRNQILNNHQELLGSWMNLESYQNKLYVVSACEFARNFIVTDSLFLYRFMDGPHPYVIENINKLSSTRTQMTLINDTNKIINIDFYLIDKNRDTYLVVDNLFDDKKYAHYMTRVKSARNYDIVEHVCENEVPGFSFDKVDYDKILKEIKK